MSGPGERPLAELFREVLDLVDEAVEGITREEVEVSLRLLVARVLGNVSQAIGVAELHRALVVGESPPRSRLDAEYQRGMSDAAFRDRQIVVDYAQRWLPGY